MSIPCCTTLVRPMPLPAQVKTFVKKDFGWKERLFELGSGELFIVSLLENRT